MRVLSLLLIMYSTACLADGVGSIPLSPKDAPLFYSVLGQDPKYHDAAFKAQEAFLIQTGFIANYDKLTSYMTTKATNTATYVIDNGTPFSSKDVFFAAGTVYVLCVKKQYSRSFKNPFFPAVTNTVSVGQQQQSLGFKISF